jgi:hypothetical protein
MENDYWKDEILDSIKGIRKAEPNPFLFTRIEARLDQSTKPLLPLRKVSMVVAGLVALLVLNTWIIFNINNSGSSEKKETYSLSFFESF